MPDLLNSVSTTTTALAPAPMVRTISPASSLDRRYQVALSFHTPCRPSQQPCSTQVGLMSSPQYHHCTTGVSPLALAVCNCAAIPSQPQRWFQAPAQIVV